MSDLDNSKGIEARRMAGSIGDTKDYNGIYQTETSEVFSDYKGRLETVANVYTERGEFREDFAGTNLINNLSGTVTFTNGSYTLTGSGTAFTTELRQGYYIKLTTDSETYYAQVFSVESDTSLTLRTAYGGSSSSGTAHGGVLAVETGTGTTTGVSSSLLTLTSGTTNSAIVAAYRLTEGGTQVLIFAGTVVSQRIANQTVTLGLRSGTSSASRRAEFSFDGTDNTVVKCISSATTAASSTETTTAYFPRGVTSATTGNVYKIALKKDKVCFYINDFLVATNRYHIGDVNYGLRAMAMITNGTGAASSTTLTVDSILAYQSNELEVTASLEPLRVMGYVNNRISAPIIESYMATCTNFTPPATPTNMFYIVGNGTKLIRVTRIEMCATQTTAAQQLFYLKRYSTAHSGGTRTFMTPMSMDTQNSSAIASPYYYTANPTLGTLVGTYAIRRTLVPTPTSLIDQPIIEWDFNYSQGQPLILRSVSEGIAVDFAGAALPTGLSVNFTVWWTEERINDY